MSSLFVDEIKKASSAAREQAKEQRQMNLQRMLKIVIIVLLIIVVLELMYHFVLSQYLLVNEIHISADQDLGLQTEYLQRVAGLNGEDNFFLCKTADIRDKLLQIPAVRDAAVSKKFPDKIFINLTGRKLLAVSLVNTTEGTVPVAFDEQGIIFKIGAEIRNFNVPVISGLNYPEIKKGMQLPYQVQGYLKQIDALGREFPELLSIVSEFRFIKKENSFSEVLLYPVFSKIRVRTRAELNEKVVKNIVLMLDIIEKTRSDVVELDFRTDEPVIIVGEG